MTILRSEDEYAKIRECGRIVSEVLGLARNMLRGGVSTREIDREVEVFIRDNGAEPAFKGYRGFPASICASPNDVVVHGIPSDKIKLEEGDIIGIDIGVSKNGFFADAARTFCVGKVSERAERLLSATEKALERGIKKAIAGRYVSGISEAIQKTAQKTGFREVRAFVGHGIGRALHEDPEIPNWNNGIRGPQLKNGMVLAIEPMFNEGTREVKVLRDGWTAVTKDKGLSAHFEHTVIVGEHEAEVLT